MIEDTHEWYRQVNSSLDPVLHDDDDDETGKAVSNDTHSYAGTIVRGVLRDDNERGFLAGLVTGSLFPLVFVWFHFETGFLDFFPVCWDVGVWSSS